MRVRLDPLEHIPEHGVDRGDRTGTGTRAVFGYPMRFDLAARFPLLTPMANFLDRLKSCSKKQDMVSRMGISAMVDERFRRRRRKA